VCNDRTLETRESLIAAFGLQVERISNADEKAQMKAWLEESYDYTAEVRDIIDSVPENERFPCVCLDPTLSFVLPDANLDDDGEGNKPITSFRRDELLEIGRSCDYKILRRLGRILTRLTYIESAADMPEHIAATSDDEIPKIPMILASKKHGRQFWRILLHIILPGTMLSARPAALLAALSLRLGVLPLTQAAEREMVMWRSKWNDINVPENWSVSCLSLLLEADQAYCQGQKDNKTSHEGDKKSSGLLDAHDRELFDRLVAFKMLELNLDSTLMAQIGWAPEKSSISIGPVATCRACQFPRSVTIMGRGGKCGHCLYSEYASPEVREKCINSRVSKEDDEPTPAIWVECSVRTCRAQYVVYNPDDLNVRPKCHYCRSQKALPLAKRSDNPAPCVECAQCLNRIIWPEEYRPPSFSKSSYKCPACKSSHKTIAEVDTNAKKISAENTISWLIHDSETSAQDLFANRSLYHTISTIGTDKFVTRIELFPPTKKPLTLKGKLIRNPDALISTLQNLISRRQTERAHCSLCFSTFHPTALNAACGRHGCLQRICRGCLSGWYGLNAPGRIINTAALACPFCRRKPAARTLAKYGMGIHAVGNLAVAVQEQGSWIYAWCRDCGFAKRYLERVCAHGMPAEVEGWTCDLCREEHQRLLLEAERERVARMIQDANMARDIYALEEAQRMRELLKRTEDMTLRRAKECPGCGVMTEKVGGCDHITCTMKGCRTHWCYICGEAFAVGKIYRHLNQAHLGYYGGDDEEWYSDYSG